MALEELTDNTVELRSCIDDLLQEGRLSQQDANAITSKTRSREQAAMHPINYIAHFKMTDQARPSAVLDDVSLCEWMSEKSQIPLFHIDPLKINVSQVTEVMSFAFAQRHQILCVSVDHQEVMVATAQPYSKGWEEQLAHIANKPITKVLANPADIARYTVEFYALSRSVFGASGIASNRSGVSNFEQLLELGDLKDPEANDQHVVNIVDWLLQYAFDQRASDIHVEPRRDICRLRFRIDGVLHQVYELPVGVSIAVVSRLKILGRMNVAEKRKPQDGRIKTKRIDGSEVELRLSTLPTAFGEKLVLRIFDPDVLLRSFNELGLLGDDQDRWNKITGKPHGIVLVTGPTGSGKTTTLYSSILF